MQVSPVDLQAWAEATGNPYPATAADKAAVLPAVIAWKQGQEAAARADRGQNSLAAPLAIAAGAGLGLAGLAAFRAFRRDGLSEPAAAQKAAEIEREVRDVAAQATSTAVAEPPAASYRADGGPEQAIRARSSRYTGPRLRGDDESGPTAAVVTDLGSKDARERGEYKARTKSGYHDPALASLDTPEKREAYLAGIAETKGTGSREFQQAQAQIQAMEVTTGPGVDPLSFIAGLSEEQRTGTTTPDEMAAKGKALVRSRTKSTASADPGHTPREAKPQFSTLRRSPQAEANRQADALVGAVSAPGPGDLDAEAGRYGNFSLNAEDRQQGLQFNLRRVNPFVAQQLDALKQRPRDYQVVQTQLVRAPQAYVPVVPPAESTGAFQALMQQYEAQGGSPSGPALAAIRNHSSVIEEQRANTTYTDLNGNPVSIAAILDKNNPIPRAVQEKGQWVAPLRAVPARNAKGEVLFQELQTRGEGNLPAPKASRARSPIGIDPKKGELFYRDSDNTLKPYIGGTAIRGTGEELGAFARTKDGEFARDADGNFIRNPRLYTGRKSDGTPIRDSDLEFAPTNSTDFYALTGGQHPYLTADEIAENEGSLQLERFGGEEDQSTKGMFESLPSLGARMMTPLDPRKDAGLPSRVVDGSRFANQGVTEGNGTDSWVFGRVEKGGEKVPLMISGYQAEPTSPAGVAGGRLRVALIDHAERTGKPLSTSSALMLATALAKEHNTDPAAVMRMASGVTAQSPDASGREPMLMHSLGRGARNALDSVYNSLGMYAGADSWELEGYVREGKIQQAADALASKIPGLTDLNSKSMGGLSQDEKVNVVAEGLTAALQDLSTTLKKYPQMADKFGVGKGEGGHGIDAFVKSYVRDWVTVRSMQMDPNGQPTYQVPNDAFEVLAHKAAGKGRTVLQEIDDLVSGSPNGLVGALKIDQMVSGAQSTKQGDPNTIATNLAKDVFLLPDSELLSTKLIKEAGGDVKLSFGSRRRFDPTAGFIGRRGPSEQQIDERIEEYGPGTFNFPDDDRPVLQVRYGVNNILKNQFRGADYQSKDGRALQDDALATQQWISENSDDLERLRADLNRGIILGPDGPVSHGRGFLITSNGRGAFIDADTQGMNDSFREEIVNDDDATPVDLAQDIRREARILGQLDSEELATNTSGLSTAGVGFRQSGLSPAEQAAKQRRQEALDRIGGRRGQEARDWMKWAAETLEPVPVQSARDPEFRGLPADPQALASQYSGQKLFFKNLGEGSRGAMPYGEARGPLTQLRRELADLADAKADYSQGYSFLGQYLGGFQGPVRGRAPGDAGISWETLRRRVDGDEIDLNPSQDDYYVEPASPEQRSVAADLDRRTLYSSTWGGTEVKPAGWRPSFDDPMIQLGVSGAPRAEVPQVGSTDAAARARQFLEARAINTQGVDRLGQAFRDDENLRDAVATSKGGYVDTVRRANAAMGQQALRMAGAGGAKPGELQAPARPERLQLDRDTLGGPGRRGSQMWSAGLGGQQKPIAAEPRSEAYGPAAHTLAAAGVSDVPAASEQTQLERLQARGFSPDEVLQERIGNAMGYLERLNAITRPSADGSRVVFNSPQRMNPYNAPGDALVAAAIQRRRAA